MLPLLHFLGEVLPIHECGRIAGFFSHAIDDETIKYYKVNATLTATITNQFWWTLYVEDVNGTVMINGTEYTITEGRGISNWVFPVLECTGVNAQGNTLDFVLRGIAWPVQAD